MNKLPLIGVVVVAVFSLGWITLSGVDVENTDKIDQTRAADLNNQKQLKSNTVADAPIFKAVSGAQKTLAERLYIENRHSILITKVTEKEWPNACLGLEGKSKLCAQVITPGYEIAMKVNGVAYTYRTDGDGSLIILASKK